MREFARYRLARPDGRRRCPALRIFIVGKPGLKTYYAPRIKDLANL
jgi:hypothetical protein